MADTKSKDSKSEKAKAEEVKVSGTGRPLNAWEGDPKAAAEATSLATPVPAEEAHPGEPVVDPNPAYDPEAPENQPDAQDVDADSK